ncbi:MAG: acyl-ACP--UDP-N-acetylglucosamine O-acyltransferase [Deltaproteobacteria bacterium]|nr:acyl-ACP--UDP-N-acetylglucosamine O-acyltransferase [Deltaproteobacteria bacterium]
MSVNRIHPTALIAPGAYLADDVEVGPYAIIEDRVEIGSGTKVMAHAVVRAYTTIGERNRIHMGAIIGHDPQDVAFDPAVESFVRIGSDNIIREYCTIHRGTKPGSETRIGSNNFLMAGSHFAHNVQVGDRVVVANNALLAGYVTLGDRVFVSGGAAVHQFCTIGRLAMLSGNGRFSCNIPPFVSALERNAVAGLNLVGLRRAGVAQDAIRELKQAYMLLYRSGLLRSEAIARMQACSFGSEEAREFLAFVAGSSRPLVRARVKGSGDE